MFLLLNTINQKPVVINSDHIQSIYKDMERREGRHIYYSVITMREGHTHHVDETVERIWEQLRGSDMRRGLL